MAGARYRAFISYSQHDNEWASRLQRWLETYRVPLDVVVEIDSSRRLGKFFRDDADMSAAADIGESVQRSIEASESLIVICSPNSAQSKWVDAEIQHFKATGRGGKVFAFIVAGVPNSGDPATECFPPSFKQHREGRFPVEPLGIDGRHDGRYRACARLAAGLLDVPFDDLWQRDRRRTVVTSALRALGAVIVVASLAATAFSYTSETDRQLDAENRQTLIVMTNALDSDTSGNVVLDSGDAPNNQMFSMAFSGRYWAYLGMTPAGDVSTIRKSQSFLDARPDPSTDILRTSLEAPGLVLSENARGPEGGASRIAVQSLMLPDRDRPVFLMAMIDRSSADEAVLRFVPLLLLALAALSGGGFLMAGAGRR